MRYRQGSAMSPINLSLSSSPFSLPPSFGPKIPTYFFVRSCSFTKSHFTHALSRTQEHPLFLVLLDDETTTPSLPLPPRPFNLSFPPCLYTFRS